MYYIGYALSEIMVKVAGKRINFDDPEQCWNRLTKAIGPGGDDYPLWSAIRKRTETKFFSAYVDGCNIVVDCARSHTSSNITKPRTINYGQFSCVAHSYNRYIERTDYIRGTITKNCGENTSYIISLIHKILSTDDEPTG